MKLAPSAPATAGTPFIRRVEDNVNVETKLEVSNLLKTLKQNKNVMVYF